MSEVWLHSNRRILLLAMVPVAALFVLGWALYGNQAMRWIGGGAMVLALLLELGLLRQLWLPRVAYRTGFVRFFLKTGGPIDVPLNIVEAFFQGQGPAHLPGAEQHQAKSVNLIARLSQRETDWQQRDVKPALGCWAEGYVTVRGTWCEPITEDVIRQLNRRLTEVKRVEAGSTESGGDG